MNNDPFALESINPEGPPHLTPASPGGRMTRRSTTAAPRALVSAVAILLTGFVGLGLWGTAHTRQEMSTVSTSTQVSAAYDRAQAALERELASELAYLDSPSPAIRAAYQSATTEFADDLLVGARMASHRDPAAVHAIDDIVALHSANVASVRTAFDAVDVRGVDSISTRDVSLEGPLETLNTRLSQLGKTEQAAVTRSVAQMRHFQSELTIAMTLLFGLGLILVAACAVTISRSRRREQRTREMADRWRLRSAARFRSLVENSTDLTCLLEPDGTISYASPAVYTLLGIRPDEMTGQQHEGLIHPDDLRMVEQAVARCQTGPDTTLQKVEFRACHHDGGWRWFEAHLSNRIADPAVAGLVLNARDVTDRKAAEATLAHSATHDGLTGLPNRTLLSDRLERALARSGRREANLALLYCDLDRFKIINDSLGHPSGDVVLREVAKRLIAAVRPGDTVARVGGDEFVICCEDLTDPTEAEDVAARVLRSLAKPVLVNGRETFVSASVGLRHARHPDSAEDLLRDADIAMYVAKQGGRNGIASFDDTLRLQSESRLEIETALHQAMDRREFRVYYQPAMAIHDGTIAGVEALLRWEHPTRGLVAPAEFIAVAEDSGLIVPIGLWVLEQACMQLASWHADGVGRFSMAVNLSARQLTTPGLPGQVADILARTGADPSEICLEVTESVLLEDASGAEVVLAQLKELGVLIAIDDFGTGYSSLGYLRRFPVDILKVDRSFVSNLGREPEATAIVTSVVHLAQALHLDTVAEGVETYEQRLQLDRLGCHLAQGYYWSRPVAADELTLWLRPHQADNTAARRQKGEGPDRPRVLIADDEQLHRDAVRRILDRSGRFEIVGEAEDGEQALALADQLHPDLVLMDLSMPRMGGLEALPRILAGAPNTKVVLLSGYGIEGAPVPEGAAAFVRKGVGAAELVDELLMVTHAAA